MSEIKSQLKSYITEINKAYLQGNATEHTHRPALKKLIESIYPKLTATNEPKRIKCGAPDYVVTRKSRKFVETIGYIGNLKMGNFKIGGHFSDVFIDLL